MRRSKIKRNERNIAKKKSRGNSNVLPKLVILLALCVILAGAGALALVKYMPTHEADEVSAQTEPAEEKTITVANAGDIIIHKPFYKSSAYKKNGDYDFSDCFSFMGDIYSSPDFMTVNLETTLPGKDAGYDGYPMFKSPDSLADSLVACGADLLLLANNHIYDSGVNGFLRTSQILADKGILYTGARHSEDEKKYLIQDIDGIKVGFVNYTFETPRSDDKKGINGNPMDQSVASYLNSFDPSDLQPFYDEMGKVLAAMRMEGAEFIIFYPHWGNEYELEACAWQKSMAQKMCDMGVDAIIGGHPHVVQPVDVLTSSDGSKKMFCAYSIGNQLSNQRREAMRLSTGNTEDGLIVQLEITRGSDGKTALSGVEYIPTWVYKIPSGPKYYIIPLNDIENLEGITGISSIKTQAEASSARTYKIIGAGIEKVKAEYGF